MNISKRSLYVLSFIAVSLLLLAGIYFYLIKTDYSNTRDASLYQISKNNLDLSAPVHVEGDVEYVMNPTKYDELKFPKIVNYPDKNIMDKVNNSLKDELDNISCDENESRPDIKPYILSTWGDFNISVDYAKNYIFSIHQEGEDDCGAYPSIYKKNLTLLMEDECGNAVQKWILYGCILKSVDGGNLDMNSDADPVIMSIGVAYDYAILEA